MAGYCECLVKRKTSSSGKSLDLILILAAVIAAVLGLFVNVYALVLTPLCIAAWFVHHRRLHVEYEYMVVGGDLRIETVYNQTKRSKRQEFALENVERVLVTADDPEIDASGWAGKVLDFSAGEEGEDLVKLLTKVDSSPVLVVLSASEKLVNALKQDTPRRAWQKFLW